MTAWNLTDLADVPKNGLTVMSTFACGGGSSMGYKLAGFDVIAGNDIDPQMAWHYKANMRPKYFFQMPIGQLVKLARAKKLPAELYSLDVLDGSPPCSVFSLAGANRTSRWGIAKRFREGQSSQVLDDLFFDYLDLVDVLRPRVSVAENVKGMITGKAKGYVSLVLERYRSMGYAVRLMLLDAADYGVPQRRRRVFFLATRDHASSGPSFQITTTKRVSAGESVRGIDKGSCSKLCASAKRLWHHTPPGKGMNVAAKKIDGVDKMWNWVRADPSKPAPTIAAKEVVCHWDEPRLLSLNERIRIGSFPMTTCSAITNPAST